MKNFYSLKDIIKRMKQATDWKEIFANVMSDKRISHRILIKPLNNKEPKFLKINKKFEPYFTKEAIQIVSAQKDGQHFVTMEMQIKITVRNHNKSI